MIFCDGKYRVIPRKEPQGLQPISNEIRFVNIPSYLVPVSMGVEDDLTSESRLDKDGVRYVTEPSASMGFFSLATAKDTRPIILHEGVPGHYFQLVLSWANPDPIRRRFFDSGANEGIAFYVEELLRC